MRWLFVLVIGVHALIHLMGFAKAFGYAELPQLTQPISRGLGVAWLAAAVLTLAAAAGVIPWPRGWFWLGAAALVASLVEHYEFAREFEARLDVKRALLEQLLHDADERIARLESLEQAAKRSESAESQAQSRPSRY